MKMELSPASQKDLDRAVQKLADAAGSTVKEVLPAQMRLFAADLAFNTRPIGKTPATQKEHQAKIMGRIMSEYFSVGAAYSFLKKDDPKKAAAFVRNVKAGNITEAATIINSTSKNPVIYSVGRFDGGKIHNEQRFRKKIHKALVCTDFKAVEVWAKKTIKLSGFAKGGYAAAARQLGGVRGIPGFATRQKAPGSGTVRGDGKTLTVTMTNDVRYIRQALDAHGEARAINHRERSVTAVIKRMMSRKMKQASPSLK